MSNENSVKKERTVVIVKPDGVKRGLVGEIIKRLEQRGLKIVALKMVMADAEQARNHYPNTEPWYRAIGEKTLENYKAFGKDAMVEIGTDDSLKIGQMIGDWNVKYLTSGPVVPMIVEGIHAISAVRKIVGHTLPSKAEMGTIRGDFSIDSPTAANADRRTIYNMVHASGDPGEATHEISHWFTEKEIQDYKRADEDVMFF